MCCCVAWSEPEIVESASARIVSCSVCWLMAAASKGTSQGTIWRFATCLRQSDMVRVSKVLSSGMLKSFIVQLSVISHDIFASKGMLCWSADPLNDMRALGCAQGPCANLMIVPIE
jgi:hypothetical protein